MSVIAYLGNYSGPIILNDLILSDENINIPIEIPILNKPYDLSDFPDGIYPVSFRSKSIIIKDNLAVAGAGEEYLIKLFFDELQDFFKHRDVTFNYLNNFFQSLENKELLSGKNIFWVIMGYEISLNRHFHCTSRNCLKEENNFIKNIFYAGSGGKEWVSKFTNNLNLTGTNPLKITEFISSVLLTNSAFINQERLSPDNLQKGWGGGWEILYFDSKNKRFAKLDKYCYLFCDLIEVEGNFDLRLDSLFHFSYLANGFLTIRNFNGQYHRYIISPINFKNIDFLPPDDSFDFQSNIIAFIINCPDKGTTFVLRYPKDNEPPVLNSFISEDGHFVVKMLDKLFPDVIDELKRGNII